MRFNNDFKKVLKSEYFYVGLLVLAFGLVLNALSMSILYKRKDSLPVLSDLILDNIPLVEWAYIYNLFSILAILLFVIYIIKKEKYKELPFYLCLFGIIYILRGIFILLTPFGNPVEAYNPIMDSFSKLRVGVYPSGHTGLSFLAFLLSDGKFKIFIGISCLMVIVLLLLAKGHYSIDIFSALIFSYAVYCFGCKYLSDLKLK